MPQTPFRAKANEYIATFLRETDAQYEMDVMEMVIDQLAVDFGVSKQAAKIRLVELGFDGAIGTFNYVDGRMSDHMVSERTQLKHIRHLR